jgi:hypothetical protein
MELAIPFLALGGMYIISNQSTEKCNPQKKQKQKTFSNKENFDNMGKRTNYLPNANIPPQNFPVTNINQLVDTVQEYPNPNVATDKYFNQNLYENKVNQGITVGQNPQQIYSLTGNYLDSAQFKHNNMVPFNGGKVKGNTYNANIAESVLDNMVGSGSQVIKKIEQAPLFKPEANMQWGYGMPNQSDFYQSRVNPGMKNNNVKPFDTEYVAPGLDQGFTKYGSNGFNSGMEARDKWLPYTVDQLRVDTNPKLEYELINHEGPANAYIKNVGKIGRVEKQKPDTFFVNSQDRYFTTTGAEKGETLRPLQEMGVIRRNDIKTDYAGPAGNQDRQAGYAPQNYEQSKRNPSTEGMINHSTAAGKGPGMDGDNLMKSFTNYANQRSTLKQPDTLRSGFSSGAIGAVIAPIMDFLRPTRKEETTNNVRIYGDATSRVPEGYVNNPNDAPVTTVKETTLYSPSFNINNQKEGTYVNNYTPMDLTQRDTTSCETFGSSGGQATQYGDMSYDAAYRQHNNDIKSQSIYNRPNQGGTQIFNQQMNVHCRDDCDRFEGRVNPAISIIPAPPSLNTYGKINTPQYYNECIGCDRIEPQILDAFRNNPFTHPLTTAV